MGKRSLLGVAAVLVCCAATLAPAGAAADNALTATTFAHVKVSVLRGDSFTISCDDYLGAPDSTYWLAYVLTNSNNTIYRGQGVSDFIEDGLAFRLRLDAETVERPGGSGSADDSVVPEYGGTVRSSENTLRVVWASWRAPMTCRVLVNGIEVPADHIEDLSRAAMAGPMQFNGGAGAEASVGGAAALSTYEREAHGWIYSWMVADGLATSRTPEGGSAGTTKTFFVGPADGLFTYKLNAAVHVPPPRVFLLEVPA